MKVDDKIRELLEKALDDETYNFSHDRADCDCPTCLTYQALSLLPKPCETCESYTTGECVSKIPCDMNYSAFKPCETKQRAGCRPEQQLNKPPAGEIEEFDRNCAGNLTQKGIAQYLREENRRLEKLLTTQAKQIKELERACKEVRAYLIRWPEKTHQPYIYIIDQALKGE